MDRNGWFQDGALAILRLNQCDYLLGSGLSRWIIPVLPPAPRSIADRGRGSRSTALPAGRVGQVDSPQPPALNCISRYSPRLLAVIALHMCYSFSTGTACLINDGLRWLSYLNASWHQLFERSPALLASEHWRQPAHINAPLLQPEDADSVSSQHETGKAEAVWERYCPMFSSPDIYRSY